ncbi:MAG: HpcH/HpaI aldolase/citrate lyase family protein [Campylobacterales bacterium]|nr:HpcH/HpaI aldolase/citrate lyase family protein [Campylobacterales bacterium]
MLLATVPMFGDDQGRIPQRPLSAPYELSPSTPPNWVALFSSRRCIPGSPQMLAEPLRMEGIERFEGFVLPKFGIDNAEAWLTLLNDNAFIFMPSIEGGDLFSQARLHALAERLRPYQARIPTVRFGLEEMLRQLGMTRDGDTPLYTLVAPAQVIATLLTVFKPRGFNLCGGVYKCFWDADGFTKELEADLTQGLFGKRSSTPPRSMPWKRPTGSMLWHSRADP